VACGVATLRWPYRTALELETGVCYLQCEGNASRITRATGRGRSPRGCVCAPSTRMESLPLLPSASSSPTLPPSDASALALHPARARVRPPRVDGARPSEGEGEPRASRRGAPWRAAEGHRRGAAGDVHEDGDAAAPDMALGCCTIIQEESLKGNERLRAKQS
jgi:hypothetical protein